MGWLTDTLDGLNWMARSHREMYDNIHSGLGVDGGMETIEHYDNADNVLQQVQSRIAKGVNDLSANWSGSAADSAAALTRASADWANTAAVATINARAQSLHQAEAYLNARNGMPEPVKVPDISPSGGFPSLTLSIDKAVAQARADAAHQEAARVMARYESATAEHIDAMPHYPPVSTAVNTDVLPPATSGGGGGGPRVFGGGGSGPGSQQQQQQRPHSGPFSPGGQPGPGSSGGNGPQANGNTSLDDFRPQPSGGSTPVPGVGGASDSDVSRSGNTRSGGSPFGGPAFGVPGDSVEPPVRGLQGGRGSGPGGGVNEGEGGANGTGRGGSGGKPTARSGSGPGRSLGPRPGGTGEITESTRGSRGVAGARGASGTPGMAPGAGRSGREDEQEHQRRYVVLDDEIPGDDNPPTPPPVIGETPY